MSRRIENFINGKFQKSKNSTIPVWSPQEGKIIAEVVESTNDDLEKAIKSANSALPFSGIIDIFSALLSSRLSTIALTEGSLW